jgi:hypothetical protein
MTCQDIINQQELDHALADDAVTCIHIKSDRGVWLRIGNTDKRIEASGSATVRAFGSATVEASGSATVEAFGSATVRAFGSATVEASGSATVEASGSATVEASGSATVEASGSATVEASGSATVRAFGSATVRAFGSATVEAFGSATVRAFGSSSVHAHRRSTVTAGVHVAVHLHDATATVEGGVVIDVSQLDLGVTTTWADHRGVDLIEGRVVLYKAVDEHLTAGQGHDMPTVYTVGTDMVCLDWEDSHNCGGGFHLSPTTSQATSYRPDAKRWLRCSAAVEDVRPINNGTPKCKVRALRVEAEVDRFGRELPAKAEVSSQ